MNKQLAKPSVSQSVLKIISWINNKGGVGKTTGALSTGIAAYLSGKKVILVDLEPQSNLSKQFISDDKIIEEKNILQALLGYEDINNCIHEINDNFHLIPANEDLSEAKNLIEKKYKSAKDDILFEKIKQIENEYDLIVIDTGPNQEFLLGMAIIASSKVIIPTTVANEWDEDGVGTALQIFSDIEEATDIDKNNLQEVILLPSTMNRKRRRFFKDKVFEELFNDFKVELDKALSTMKGKEKVRISQYTIPFIENALLLSRVRSNSLNEKLEIITEYNKFVKAEGL